MRTRSSSRAESREERHSPVSASSAAQLRPAPAPAMPDESASSLAQLQHQQMANNSRQAAQLKSRADIMASGGVEAPVQRVEDEEVLQGKFGTVQPMEDEELLQGQFAPVLTGNTNASQLVAQRVADGELEGTVVNVGGRLVARINGEDLELPNATRARAVAQDAIVCIVAGNQITRVFNVTREREAEAERAHERRRLFADGLLRSPEIIIVLTGSRVDAHTSTRSADGIVSQIRGGLDYGTETSISGGNSWQDIGFRMVLPDAFVHNHVPVRQGHSARRWSIVGDLSVRQEAVTVTVFHFGPGGL